MSHESYPNQSKVLRLVDRFTSVQEYHPLVAELISTYPDFEVALNDTLLHEYDLMCRRSGDLADNEITLAQAAFATLYAMHDNYYGALALWVEEILGVSALPVEKKPAVVAAAVKVTTMTLDRLHEYQDDTCCSSSNVETRGVKHGPNTGTPDFKSATQPMESSSCTIHETSYQEEFIHPTRRENVSSSRAAPEPDARLMRLFQLYNHAREDFESVRKTNLEATAKARFLRDTIENCISYMNTTSSRSWRYERESCCVSFAEMMDLLVLTKSIVEQACGWKKRHFDHQELDVPLESPPKKRHAPKIQAHRASSVDVVVHHSLEAPNAGQQSVRLGRYAVMSPNDKPHQGRYSGKRNEAGRNEQEFDCSYVRSRQGPPIAPGRYQNEQRKPLSPKHPNQKLASRSPPTDSPSVFKGDCYRPYYE